MKLAIMQPYFFPYIGYFQLMNAVDEFVMYDNIEYSKKGWINRNRILVNGADAYLTISLKKDSDYLHIIDRYLAEIWPDERRKLLNRISESYRKAPYFEQVLPVLTKSLQNEERNLFKFLMATLETVKNYLGISTPFRVSSSIPIDHSLRASEKVLALCKACGAEEYINPIGGVELYSKDGFKRQGVDLRFLKADNIQYQQLSNEFVPFLSIIDVMMFNSKERIGNFLNQYTLS
jgi:hypothetical protein